MSVKQVYPALFNEEEAASYISVSRHWLRNTRHRDVLPGHVKPPPHIKIGRMVRYRPKDLDAWVERYRKETM